MTAEITNSTRKMKNRILAICAAPEAMPVKPMTPAMIEMTRKMSAHLSMAAS